MNDPHIHCGSCGGTRQVVWSQAHEAWLCVECRRLKTDETLNGPVTPLPMRETP